MQNYAFDVDCLILRHTSAFVQAKNGPVAAGVSAKEKN